MNIIRSRDMFVAMGLDEKEVFEILTDDLDDKGYRFLVDCNYDSINSQYKSHNIIIGRSVPDIIGISPENSIVAIEVKGSKDLTRGKGQAHNYMQKSELSFLAADKDALETREAQIRNTGVGTIAVSPDGSLDWTEPNRQKSISGVLEVRSRLRGRFNNTGSISRIASLDLTHPVNFLSPAVYLSRLGPQEGLPENELTSEISTEYQLGETAVRNSIEACSVLGLIEKRSEITLTRSGQVCVSILASEGIESLPELRELKSDTSHNRTLRSVKPVLSEWLQQQYRLHPEFNAIYEIIQDFEPGEGIELTEISRVLIEEHPNVFLRVFCTEKEDSRRHARRLIMQGQGEEIINDPDTFRGVLRHNIVQNFKRQMAHLGVITGEGGTTTEKIEEFDPEEYPWVPMGSNRMTQLGSYT